MILATGLDAVKSVTSISVEVTWFTAGSTTSREPITGR